MKTEKSINFFKSYINLTFQTLNSINLKKIDKINNFLEKAIIKNKKIFVAGNGGSGSVANHFLCDFNKGIKLSSSKKLFPKVISLSNSIEIISAIGNDLSFKKIFSFQLENYLNKEDIVILFSCSGKSPNIIEVIKQKKNLNFKLILITGFLSKKNKIADVHLDLNCKNYGITEDIFSSLMHMISQNIRKKYSNNKKEIL